MSEVRTFNYQDLVPGDVVVGTDMLEITRDKIFIVVGNTIDTRFIDTRFVHDRCTLLTLYERDGMIVDRLSSGCMQQFKLLVSNDRSSS